MHKLRYFEIAIGSFVLAGLITGEYFNIFKLIMDMISECNYYHIPLYSDLSRIPYMLFQQNNPYYILPTIEWFIFLTITLSIIITYINHRKNKHSRQFH
jgi:hypothetical protein